MSGQLFVVSAPSGGGKTSLVKALLAQDDRLQVSVSHTTRAPRAGEQSGENYFFVNAAEFNQLVAAEAFIEHAEVFSHQYGTSWASIQQIIAKGQDAILEIDWQGARLISAQMDCTTIFILPPSREVLLTRLKHRGLDSAEVIAQRMAQATAEMTHYTEYDYVVFNDQFETALSQLQVIISASRLKTASQQAMHPDLLSSLLK